MAGVAALGTMVAVLMLAFWFRNVPNLKNYVTYSMISVAVIFLSGGLTAAALANQYPLFGLIERITIFTFILWVSVIARKMVQLEAQANAKMRFQTVRSTSKGK